MLATHEGCHPVKTATAVEGQVWPRTAWSPSCPAVPTLAGTWVVTEGGVAHRTAEAALAYREKGNNIR